MQVVCEVCKKSCSSITSSPIKDGYMCVDCAVKMDGYVGKKHDSSKISGSEYIDVLAHPLNSKKIRKKANAEKQACVGCGKLELWNIIDGTHGLCQECGLAVYTVIGQYDAKQKFDYSSHDFNWYKEELEECYCPNHSIMFNFKTQRVFMADALTKKNYKMVNFSDLITYNVTSSMSGGNMVRFLDLDYRYNGATTRYHTDDSFEASRVEKVGEFAKLLECLSMIPTLNSSQPLNNHVNSVGNQQIENAQMNNTYNSSNAGGFRCPKCGGVNCTPIVETSTSGKDFSAGKGCCGAVLLGPIGILCGACGKGKQVTSTTYWMCGNCGNKFQA